MEEKEKEKEQEGEDPYLSFMFKIPLYEQFPLNSDLMKSLELIYGTPSSRSYPHFLYYFN